MVSGKFIVIGSNCFTGSHFVDFLVENPSNFVVGVGRSSEKSALYLPYKRRPSLSNFEFHQIDLVRDYEKLFSLIDSINPDYVINVAGLSEVLLSQYQPIEYFETNTVGVVRLANFLRQKKFLRRYIHISSAEVYGSCAAPISEEQSLNPSTPYAVSKASADMYLLTLIKNFQFPATLIRSTNVYGQYQQLFKIIPRTVINLKLGKTIQLHGGGKAVKSFIHIADVIRGAMMTLEVSNPHSIYHFSTTNNASISDIVHKICRLLGQDPQKHITFVDERLGQDSKYLLSTTRAQQELSWSPSVPFDQGIQEVVQWISESWDAIQLEPHEYIHKV